MNSAVSSQKAFQGFETEMRELLRGAEEISVFLRRGIIGLPSRQMNDFLQKRKQKNIVKVAIPGVWVG